MKEPLSERQRLLSDVLDRQGSLKQKLIDTEYLRSYWQMEVNRVANVIHKANGNISDFIHKSWVTAVAKRQQSVTEIKNLAFQLKLIKKSIWVLHCV